jgi:TonB family protein
MSIRQALFGIAVVAASAVVFAQTIETKPPDKETSEPPASNPCRSWVKGFDQAEILTDTLGADFGPYMTRITQIVRQNWYNLMPYPPILKQGKLSIEFVILKDGKTTGMVVHTSSGDVALDRAAWRSIKESTPFPALPAEFPGKLLGLRFYYFYNLSSDISWISISPCGDVEVSAGSTLQFSASGKGITNTSVKWSVSGNGFCLKSTCGTISDAGLYTAPADIPFPPTVTVEAASRTDPSIVAKSKITVVQANPPH